MVIHGGAGNIVKSAMTAEKEAAYLSVLDESMQAGIAILNAGGEALDATEAAVRVMEDSILFNAGRGSVYANSGKQEMDAALMCGKQREAGSICGVTGVRNPITLARKVLSESEHVMLSGEGAMQFAREQELPFEKEEWFHSEYRYQQWLKARELGEVQIEHHPFPDGEEKFGTVGAVACDLKGNVAAATSTGGMTNKKYGRIGDSSIIGVGNYADNRTCAVSCTGHGEYFMRSVVAYDIACLIEYKEMKLHEACERVIYDKLLQLGGKGGVIAVDGNGSTCMTFNSEGMYRGRWDSESGEMVLGIFR